MIKLQAVVVQSHFISMFDFFNAIITNINTNRDLFVDKSCILPAIE